MKIRYQWFIILGAVIVAVLSWTVLRPEPKPIPLETIPVTDNPPLDVPLDDLFRPSKIRAKYERTESGAHRLSGSIPLPVVEDGCMDLKMLSPNISEDQLLVELIFRTQTVEKKEGEECRKKGTWVTAINANEEAEFIAN